MKSNSVFGSKKSIKPLENQSFSDISAVFSDIFKRMGEYQTIGDALVFFCNSMVQKGVALSVLVSFDKTEYRNNNFEATANSIKHNFDTPDFKKGRRMRRANISRPPFSRGRTRRGRFPSKAF